MEKTASVSCQLLLWEWAGDPKLFNHSISSFCLTVFDASGGRMTQTRQLGIFQSVCVCVCVMCGRRKEIAYLFFASQDVKTHMWEILAVMFSDTWH